MPEEGLIDRIKRKVIEKRILFRCQLDLTYQCNLKCLHCCVTPEDRFELETFEIKHIIDELAAMGTLYLGLSGGEVLTREDFFEICEYARKLHFALRILTNGTLVDEEVADKLAAVNPERIDISIYSSNPEIHDEITGVPGSFHKAIKAVKILKKRNLNVKIKTVIMKQNINDYNGVYEISERLGASFAADPTVTTKINGDKTPLQFRINSPELYRVLADPLIKTGDEAESLEYIPRNSKDEILCIAAHCYGYVSPYGDVFPCVQFPFNCGNLRQSSLKEIWYHSPEMLEISSLRRSELRVCSKCKLIDQCRYCPGISYLEENDLMEPPKIKCQETELLNLLKGDKNGEEEKIPKTIS